jgi:hypothetical protein
MSSGVTNGIYYIGGSGPNDFINNQSSSIDGNQTIESGVLAGPVSVPATVTITGTLVIV